MALDLCSDDDLVRGAPRALTRVLDQTNVEVGAVALREHFLAPPRHLAEGVRGLAAAAHLEASVVIDVEHLVEGAARKRPL
eukprot:11637748-Alexandrium_andersonii.AAC.1